MVNPPPLPPFNVQKLVKIGERKTTSKLLDSGWTPPPPFWTMSERKTFFYGFFKVPNESFANGARSVLLLISRQKEHGVLSREPDSKLTYSHGWRKNSSFIKILFWTHNFVAVHSFNFKGKTFQLNFGQCSLLSAMGCMTSVMWHVQTSDMWNIMYYRDILQICLFNHPVLNLYPKSPWHHLLVGQKTPC